MSGMRPTVAWILAVAASGPLAGCGREDDSGSLPSLTRAQGALGGTGVITFQDRMSWILLRRLWRAWSNVLVMVKPETVVSRHRAGFCFFWHLRSPPWQAKF